MLFSRILDALWMFHLVGHLQICRGRETQGDFQHLEGRLRCRCFEAGEQSFDDSST